MKFILVKTVNGILYIERNNVCKHSIWDALRFRMILDTMEFQENDDDNNGDKNDDNRHDSVNNIKKKKMMKKIVDSDDVENVYRRGISVMSCSRRLLKHHFVVKLFFV